LVVSNATTLAGICLAQLSKPGAPVVYGLGGSPTDMRTGGYVNAAPEDVQHVALAGAMGRYYHMPSRGQGALTESFALDYQAGMESAMMLTAAALSGVNVGLHACGTYGSMLAMSFEKFLADEDLCGAVKKLIEPVALTENDLALDVIKEIGFSGNYLTAQHTFERCRKAFFIPDLAQRVPHAKWQAMPDRDMTERAGKHLEKRLAAYRPPPIDPTLEKDLAKFVESRKGGVEYP
jgi:trimethylamine--corrinoid protein Co-methyltransferase